ncbi:MAG: hypothetical protein ACTSWL_09645, partial [Promethearchaeota archaeon]
MHTIYRVYGLAQFRDRIVTKSLIIKNFGQPNEICSCNNYSKEMVYKELGIKFSYLPLMDNEGKKPSELPKTIKISPKKDDKSEIDTSNSTLINDPEIFEIAFVMPFKGKTEEGIMIGRSTMDEVFRIFGKEAWLTAEEEPYWWVEYSGISFYVNRDKSKPIYPFDENTLLSSPIIQITVPISEREDDIIKNEHGFYVKSAEDYCIDGKEHDPIHDDERAEIICSKCGLVMSERMINIELSGSRAFSKAEQDKRQTHGSPVNPLIPDLQMATMIDKRAHMSEGLRKAVKWDSRYTWKQRNMIQATSEIKRIGEILHLPSHVKIYAIRLYRQSFQRGLLKGRSIRAMVAATIYYSCGAEKIPRTL